MMSEQFYSCSEDEHPGSELGTGDPQQKHIASKSVETNEENPFLPRNGDATSDGNPASITQLPASTPVESGLATPLIRPSSRMLPIRTTRWRWVMLLIFALNMAVSGGILSTFIPADRVLEDYYSRHDTGWKPWVKHLAVYDTVVKVLLLLPSAWMLIRYELKFTVVFASFATALGSALRLIGASK